MAYVDTPLAAQRIKDSQPLIRQNFVEISTLIDVDHYTFGSPTAGEHKKVTLPDQGLPVVFPAGDVGLFGLLPTANPLTGVVEMFVNRSDGTQTNITGAAKISNGWAYLPSGILIKWGLFNTVGVNPFNFLFPVAPNIPVFNTAFFVLCADDTGLPIIQSTVPVSLTTLGFSVNSFISNTGAVPAASNCIYLAFGT